MTTTTTGASNGQVHLVDASEPGAPEAPPHSLQAEEAVLGAIFKQGLALADIVCGAAIPRTARIGDAGGALELLGLLFLAVRGHVRPREDLVMEHLLLRHQLSVLTRPTRTRARPRLRAWDRLLWVLARRFCAVWRQHLAMVSPDTVVRWHRQGWRLFWPWKARHPGGRPRLSADVQELIATMSRESRLWGTERIRCELLKVGIVVSNRSIRRYRWLGPVRPPSQTWRTFVANHATSPRSSPSSSATTTPSGRIGHCVWRPRTHESVRPSARCGRARCSMAYTTSTSALPNSRLDKRGAQVVKGLPEEWQPVRSSGCVESRRRQPGTHVPSAPLRQPGPPPG